MTDQSKQIDISALYRQAFQRFDQGAFAESAQLYGEIANYYESFPSECKVVAKASFFNSYGLALKRCGNLTLAEQIYLVSNKLSGFQDPCYLNNLAVCYFEMGDYSQSEHFYLKSIEILKSRGNDSSSLAFNQSNLGTLLTYRGDFSDAKNIFVKSLEKFNEIGSWDNIAHTQFRIGSLLCQMGYFPEAIRFLKAGFSGKSSIYSRNHPRVAEIMLDLAEVYLAQRKLRKAESRASRALVIFENTLIPNAPLIGRCHLLLAEAKCLKGLGHANFQDNLKKAYVIFKTSYLNSKNPDMAGYYALRGELLMYEAKYSKAIFYLQKSLRIRQELLKPVHPALAVTLNHLGYCYAKLGQISLARKSYIRSLHILRRIHRCHSWLPMLLRNIAMLYQGRMLEKICLNRGRKIAEGNVTLLKDANLEEWPKPSVLSDEKPKTKILPEARIILIATADMEYSTKILEKKITAMVNYYQGKLPELSLHVYVQGNENSQKIIDEVIIKESERPFYRTFICLVGKNYGTVPKLNSELLKRLPWMTDYRDRAGWEVILRSCIHSEVTGTVYHLSGKVSKTDIENPYQKIQSMIRELKHKNTHPKVKTVAIHKTDPRDIEYIMYRLNSIILQTQKRFQTETSNGDAPK